MTRAARIRSNALHVLANCRAYPRDLVTIAWNYLRST